MHHTKLNEKSSKGRLFVISSPSGGGKTTIINRLLDEMTGIAPSISHTTRTIRDGESDGEDYYYVTETRFMEMVKDGLFLEWAEVYGNYYGTSLSSVETALAGGQDVLLDVDVQGGSQIKESIPGAVLIFIVLPDPEEFERRLRARGTDGEEDILRRLESARQELALVGQYDYAVPNNDIDEAVKEVRSIISTVRKMIGT
jgi:guanylate kinase